MCVLGIERTHAEWDTEHCVVLLAGRLQACPQIFELFSISMRTQTNRIIFVSPSVTKKFGGNTDTPGANVVKLFTVVSYEFS